jgi:hypothetical protein
MRKTALLALVGSAAAFAPAGVPSLRSTNAVRSQAVTELRVCVAHLDSPTLKIATRRLPSRIQKWQAFTSKCSFPAAWLNSRAGVCLTQIWASAALLQAVKPQAD